MAMQRCWLVSRQWSLPLRLACRSSVPPVAKLSSLQWNVSKYTGKKQQQQVAVGLPSSSFHTSSMYCLKDEDTTSDTSSSSDSDSSVSTDEAPAEVLDESGFKMDWAESSDEEWAGQSGEDRTAILESALSQVSTHGWSEEALRMGALNVGVTDLDHALFPNGAGDLVQHFEDVCHGNLVKYLQELSEQEQKGAKLLRSAVEYRLRMLEPYLDSWPQAMAVKALPGNVMSSLQSAGVMVDEMWYWAGDRSTDLNWYSKRALLTSIYLATELFMIQDQSLDRINTWKFLDQRFEDVSEFGKISSQVEGVLKGGMDFLKSGITTASQYACRAKE